MDQPTTTVQTTAVAAVPEPAALVQLSSAGVALAGEGGTLRFITASMDYTFTVGEPSSVRVVHWGKVLSGSKSPAGEALLELVPGSSSTVAAAPVTSTSNTATEVEPSHGV